MKPKKETRRGPATDNVARFTINEDTTLLAAAAQVLPHHKPTKLKSLLRHNQLAINGVPHTQFDHPVTAGDELWVNFDRSFQVFSHPRVKLVYEDNDIIVVDKGYGVLSTAAGRPSDDTVFSIVRKYARGFSDKAAVYVVHRLDRDTSGLMLLTRTKQARDRLLNNWNNMVVERKYVAVVEGKMQQAQGTVKSFLAENEETFEMYSTSDQKAGRLAVTHYRVIEQGRKFAMVELQLKTGRKNQIRVHMEVLGHPVVGDYKYGSIEDSLGRLGLHAFRLAFIHPITHEELEFETPFPTVFLDLFPKQMI